MEKQHGTAIAEKGLLLPNSMSLCPILTSAIPNYLSVQQI